MSTTIEWTQRPGTTGETWNPVVGCTKVSQGCKHCYAKALHDKRHKAYLAGRLQGVPQYAKPFEQVQLMHDRITLPLKWRKPRTVFVNSVSDLFHEDVPFEFIDKVFAVMALTPQHTYQVLTKRPERMAKYFNELVPRGYGHSSTRRDSVAMVGSTLLRAGWMHPFPYDQDLPWPLPNVWLGTSAEDQATADERIPHLLKCLAAVRFLSCEPLLGVVDIFDNLSGPSGDCGCTNCEEGFPCSNSDWYRAIDWVIAGGESGPGARPMHPDWVRSLLHQCKEAGVPFFFKQWGQWLPSYEAGERAHDIANYRKTFGERWAASSSSMQFPDGQGMVRVGKGNSGHLLDGQEHHEWPTP